jgi:hypothetical protein
MQFAEHTSGRRCGLLINLLLGICGYAVAEQHLLKVAGYAVAEVLPPSGRITIADIKTVAH